MTNDTGLPRFISDLCRSLHVSDILYVACKSIDDLAGFAPDSHVCGICDSARTLAVFAERYPLFGFRQAGYNQMPYKDGSFTMVFAHGLFGTEPDTGILDEMHRVSSRYIASFETLPECDHRPDLPRDNAVSRYWLGRNVMVVSNVQMHPDIDPEKPQFVLAKKLN